MVFLCVEKELRRTQLRTHRVPKKIKRNSGRRTRVILAGKGTGGENDRKTFSNRISSPTANLEREGNVFHS